MLMFYSSTVQLEKRTDFYLKQNQQSWSQSEISSYPINDKIFQIKQEEKLN